MAGWMIIVCWTQTHQANYAVQVNIYHRGCGSGLPHASVQCHLLTDKTVVPLCRLGNVASTETAFQLQYTKHHADNNSSATQVQSAETSSASSNAAAGVKHSSNIATATATRRSTSAGVTGKVTVASAAGLPQVNFAPCACIHEKTLFAPGEGFTVYGVGFTSH